jgi:hypothetical protein
VSDHWSNLFPSREKFTNAAARFVAEDESDLCDLDIAKEESDRSTTTMSGLPEADVVSIIVHDSKKAWH